MRRWSVWLCLAVLVVSVAACLGTLVLARTTGYAVDWRALLRLQPPILRVQQRVVRIWYQHPEEPENQLSDRDLVGLDVWSVTDEFILGAATDPNIRRLRRAGFTVDVLYDSLEEYSEAAREGEDDQ
jgi:hypothetical protein